VGHLEVSVDDTHLEVIFSQLLGHHLSLLLGVYIYDAEPDVDLLEQLADYLLLRLFVPDLALLLPDALQR